MPKTWIVRQGDVTLLLLCVLLSSHGLKMSNFFIGQILQAFLVLFWYFFCRKKLLSMEASRHYWKLKKQNRRGWNSVWGDQSIPCLAIDDVCGQPGAVCWRILLCVCGLQGCSSAGHSQLPESLLGVQLLQRMLCIPALVPDRGHQGTKTRNTKCQWALYSRVSCPEGQHRFPELGHSAAWPQPSNSCCRERLGWSYPAGQRVREGDREAGTKKGWKEVKSAL